MRNDYRVPCVKAFAIMTESTQPPGSVMLVQSPGSGPHIWTCKMPQPPCMLHHKLQSHVSGRVRCLQC
ncbi:hypothetical protein VTI28DRAFT_5989 [Corynascus sepedonium]